MSKASNPWNRINRRNGETIPKTQIDKLVEEFRLLYLPKDLGRKLQGAELKQRKRELEERDAKRKNK